MAMVLIMALTAAISEATQQIPGADIIGILQYATSLDSHLLLVCLSLVRHRQLCKAQATLHTI
jgi:hypothetical protein